MKKNIFAASVCLGLLFCPVTVSATPVAGIFSDLGNTLIDVTSKAHVAGVFSDLDSMLAESYFAEPETETEEIDPEPILVEIHPVMNEETMKEILKTDRIAAKEFEEDCYLIAWLTVAEAEGEPETGQRLVIDVPINRCLSSEFPNRIPDVVYQSGQFTSVWNGRMDSCKDKVTDEMVEMVKEEFMNRTNTDVLYFTAGHYGDFGTPLFKHGNHYFCTK